MGTCDDTLVQEALQSDDIRRYLVEEDFARQTRLAAEMIVEQYQDKDKDERIIEGIVNLDYASGWAGVA